MERGRVKRVQWVRRGAAEEEVEGKRRGRCRRAGVEVVAGKYSGVGC